MKKFGMVIFIQILVCFSVMYSQSVKAQVNGLVPINGIPTFIRGANLAWLDGNYGTDIGVNPEHPTWGVHYNSSHMNQYMADMKKMGVNVLRMWLFESDQGLVFSGGGNVGNVVGLDSTFLANLDNIVYLAGQNGLHMYFTLLNDPMGDNQLNIITNSTSRADYINNALIPLVERYKGNPNIFAFDIENECESQVTGNTGNYTNNGTDWATMRSFIAACANAIHSADPGRLCTSTSGWHSWSNLQAGLFSGLGLDFYDCHVYADSGYLPAASSLNLDKPVIIGEFGQSSTTRNDTTQNSATYNFVNNAINNGYAGCAIWNYEYPGSTDYLGMLETDGSWRPACYTLQSFYDKSIDGDGTSQSTIIYDFENSTDGWTGSNLSGGPWSVTEWHATGSYSLKADVNLASNASYYLEDLQGNNFSGKTQLTATVTHAAWGTYSGGMTCKLFVQVGSGWAWYDGGSVQIGTGNTVLTLNLSAIPNLNQVKALGVQFVAGNGDSGGSAVYVDDVTLK